MTFHNLHVPELQRFYADTLCHAVTLTFDPLTLKVCGTIDMIYTNTKLYHRLESTRRKERVLNNIGYYWLLNLMSLPYFEKIFCMSGMLHPLYGMNSPLISVSLVRHSLLHFLLSHMAVHHLHHLHYHHLHLFLLAQCFILNSRPGSSANPFLHRPFPLLPD